MLESKIRKLIKILEETESISEIEVTGWGSKIRVSKKASGNNNHNNSHTSSSEEAVPLRTITIPVPPTAEAPPSPTTPVPAPTPERKLVGIRSPMVGTFYRAAAPTAKPYVEEGQEVKVGQVVCIIEAMKLMNEIESDVAGRLVKVCIENAKAVEFGQDLFLVEPFSP